MDLGCYFQSLATIDTFRHRGTVREVVGLSIESDGPDAGVGDICEVQLRPGEYVRVQVVGFRSGRLVSMALEETDGLRAGAPVILRSGAARVRVGKGLLGRVVDAFGLPLDGSPPTDLEAEYPLFATPPGPLQREHITKPLITGIRAIDGLLTCGKGQRIGIFGGSGVGKSTLLGSMARNHKADVTVIALVGERNREVRGFIEHELGPEALARSVLVTATSDKAAPLRVRACFTALAIAEFFRDQGADVLLVADSVTRLAMAQREIGLAAGEPPTQKGYPPSVFQLMPRIFERAGNFNRGSITGFFTVLVEGDDLNEPICDAVRGILDGHIVLSRELGNAGHYPAIDILHSVSRLATQLATPEQRQASYQLREALALYHRAEDLINLGAYVSGSNAKLDAAIHARPQLEKFLRQTPRETAPINTTIQTMAEIAATMRQ